MTEILLSVPEYLTGFSTLERRFFIYLIGKISLKFFIVSDTFLLMKNSSWESFHLTFIGLMMMIGYFQLN